MRKAAKYLAPVSFSLSCLMCYGLIGWLFGRVSDLGGAILAAVFFGSMILTLLLLALPAYCFLYGRHILRHEKKKLLLLLYNAAIPALSYLLPLAEERETYLYSLLLFLWAALWSALPLLKKKNHRSQP